MFIIFFFYVNHSPAVPWHSLRWRRCPRYPHRKSPAALNFLHFRGCAALWTRGQLEEDLGPLSVCTLEEYYPPYITIGGSELKAVYQFFNLLCTITSDSKIDREEDNRVAKANNAFGRLYKRVWNNKHLKKGTMISIYRSVVLTTLLYDSESWVTYRHHTITWALSSALSLYYPQHSLE